MRMVSIASGSSGNCIYIGSDKTHILVDAGISNKRIQQGLNDIGLKGGDVDGILITSVTLTSDLADICVDFGVPVVLFNRYMSTPGIRAVCSDNVQAGETARTTFS